MKSIRRRSIGNAATFSVEAFWCGICHLRIAPYEMALRVATNIYHAHCLDRLRHKQTLKLRQEQREVS
jgi:hypothetical protein